MCMDTRPRRGSSQPDLFPRSMRPTIPIDESHRLVQLAIELDWTELECRAEVIRGSKLKNGAGRPPHLRALLGAMVLRATRYMPYRVLEDQIRHYAPARYLCGLTETEWSPDHNTLHDFIELMGEEGARLINEYVVERAVEEKLADPKVLVADTTAQEAAIPYPNEIGLMAVFIAAVSAASQKAGQALKKFAKAAQAAPSRFKPQISRGDEVETLRERCPRRSRTPSNGRDAQCQLIFHLQPNEMASATTHLHVDAAMRVGHGVAKSHSF